MSFYSELYDKKVIAILRNIPMSKTLDTAEAMYKAGIRFLEVTLNSEDALKAIDKLKEKYDGKMNIGAGTVTNETQAVEAIDAGAEFLITPNLEDKTIEIALNKNIPIIPGVMTPSEIVKAINIGAKAVKLFPAVFLGTAYIKEIKGPLNNVPFIATGTI